MSDERLKPCAITQTKQSSEMGCGPTSVAMVLSGFGINTTEQMLAERYFPTALLPMIDPNSNKINPYSGTDNQQLIEGMVQTLESMGLHSQLRVDVFCPWLLKYTSSPQERYIVEAMPKAMREYGEKFKEDDLSSKRVRAFYRTLERLVKNEKIGVYTANARMMKLDTNFSNLMFTVPKHVINGFYEELTDFVKKGHIVGPHGGGTAHIRAFDGSKFIMLDPNGESYPMDVRGLIMIRSDGVYGDTFDYLFRVSPREEILNPRQYGSRNYLQNFRRRLLSR